VVLNREHRRCVSLRQTSINDHAASIVA